MTLPNGYHTIAGQWSYAPLRVGLIVRNPDGEEIYFQPGDDASEAMNQIEAIQDLPESRAPIIAAMVFGEYF
jgi:hypothetical protein